VKLFGVFACQSGVAHDGILMSLGQSACLAHSVAFGHMFDDRDDFLFGKSGIEKDGTAVFGKTFFANFALEESSMILTVGITDADIFASANAVFGTVFIRTAKVF